VEVLIGEARKEFNTEVAENTGDTQKKEEWECRAEAGRYTSSGDSEAAFEEAEEEIGEEGE
jgi:hypothetical protein